MRLSENIIDFYFENEEAILLFRNDDILGFRYWTLDHINVGQFSLGKELFSAVVAVDVLLKIIQTRLVVFSKVIL